MINLRSLFVITLTCAIVHGQTCTVWVNEPRPYVTNFVGGVPNAWPKTGIPAVPEYTGFVYAILYDGMVCDGMFDGVYDCFYSSFDGVQQTAIYNARQAWTAQGSIGKRCGQHSVVPSSDVFPRWQKL